MSHALDSKQAASVLIDPLNAPEPSAETGPGGSLGNTLSTNNPFRDSTSSKNGASAHSRNVSNASNRSARSHRSGGRPENFPEYRAEAFGEFEAGNRRSSSGSRPPRSVENVSKGHRRRTSSLNKRFPGDDSDEPLKILRKDSKKAYRSPHLSKRQLPGTDTIDKLDPAIGGVAYHHEGPYDAALMSRNRDAKNAPIAALDYTNSEAIRATPRENVRDSITKHRPLDGVAMVAPGQKDQFGRVYNYEEGADLMHEDAPDGPGYKRWANKEYAPDDLKGKGEPEFSLDKAMRTHKITDSGIEMSEGSALMNDYHNQERHGKADRDVVDAAGDDGKYADVRYANDTDTGIKRGGSIREGLKKRIGSLKHKKKDSNDA